MNPDQQKQHYLRQLLHWYLDLPHTPNQSSRLDRLLAQQLWHRQVRLQDIEMAMLLATARRLARSPQAPPLGPIRSLHYFLPLIEEVIQQPPSESYVDYLRQKVAQLTRQP